MCCPASVPNEDGAPKLHVWIGSGCKLIRSAGFSHSFDQGSPLRFENRRGLPLVLEDLVYQFKARRFESGVEERIDWPIISISTHARSFDVNFPTAPKKPTTGRWPISTLSLSERLN